MSSSSSSAAAAGRARGVSARAFRDRYRKVCAAAGVAVLDAVVAGIGADEAAGEGTHAPDDLKQQQHGQGRRRRLRPGSPLSPPLPEEDEGDDEDNWSEDVLGLLHVDLNGCDGVDEEQLSALVACCLNERGATDTRLGLDLESCELGPAEAHTLGKATARGAVKELRLRGSFAERSGGVDGVDGGASTSDSEPGSSASCVESLLTALCSSPPARSAGGGGAAALAKLNLGLADLSSEATVSQLTASFRWLTGLRSLELESCRLGDSGVAAVCDAILAHEVAGLRALDLSDNGCGKRGANGVARVLSTVPVEELWLADNALGDVDLQSLAVAAQQSGNCLRRLDVSGNDVGYIGALRQLSDLLMDERCQLAKLRLRGLRGPVDDRAIEFLGAAIAANDSLTSVDMRTAPARFCTASKDAMNFLQESLDANSKITVIQLSMAPGEEHLLTPILRILGLNQKLTFAIKQRKLKRPPQQESSPTKAHPKRAAAAVRPAAGLAPISPKVMGAISRWKENASDTTFGWGDDDDDDDDDFEDDSIGHSGADQAAPAGGLPGYSPGLASQVEELRNSIHAARCRAEAGAAALEEDLFGRVLVAEARLDALGDQTALELGTSGERPGAAAGEEKLAERREQLAGARIARLEDRMKHTFLVTEALANVSRNVSEEVMDMERLISEEQGREEALSRQADGTAMAQVVTSAFDRCKQDMDVLEATYVHDRAVSDALWQERMERGLALLDERVRVLLKTVVKMHQDNIGSLEMALAQKGSTGRAGPEPARSRNAKNRTKSRTKKRAGNN